jgi:cysteine-rich repeat protein
VVEGDEPCDDGNQDNTDACLNNCEAARCGDGFVQVGVEACEDGNDVDSDECVGCRLARCGDGVVHFGQEDCDDGAANNDGIYGGCTGACTLGPRCGDGKLNGPEDCDDNNSDPQDGCLAGCVEATSCKQVLELAPTAKTGKYRLWPALLGGDVELRLHDVLVAQVQRRLLAQEVVQETQTQLAGILPYADSLKWLFLVLAIAGIGLTIWARIDDHKKGAR